MIETNPNTPDQNPRSGSENVPAGQETQSQSPDTNKKLNQFMETIETKNSTKKQILDLLVKDCYQIIKDKKDGKQIDTNKLETSENIIFDKMNANPNLIPDIIEAFVEKSNNTIDKEDLHSKLFTIFMSKICSKTVLDEIQLYVQNNKNTIPYNELISIIQKHNSSIQVEKLLKQFCKDEKEIVSNFVIIVNASSAIPNPGINESTSSAIPNPGLIESAFSAITNGVTSIVGGATKIAATGVVDAGKGVVSGTKKGLGADVAAGATIGVLGGLISNKVTNMWQYAGLVILGGFGGSILGSNFPEIKEGAQKVYNFIWKDEGVGVGKAVKGVTEQFKAGGVSQVVSSTLQELVGFDKETANGAVIFGRLALTGIVAWKLLRLVVGKNSQGFKGFMKGMGILGSIGLYNSWRKGKFGKGNQNSTSGSQNSTPDYGKENIIKVASIKESFSIKEINDKIYYPGHELLGNYNLKQIGKYTNFDQNGNIINLQKNGGIINAFQNDDDKKKLINENKILFAEEPMNKNKDEAILEKEFNSQLEPILLTYLNGSGINKAKIENSSENSKKVSSFDSKFNNTINLVTSEVEKKNKFIQEISQNFPELKNNTKQKEFFLIYLVSASSNANQKLYQDLIGLGLDSTKLKNIFAQNNININVGIKNNSKYNKES